jgi:hypothetical protein
MALVTVNELLILSMKGQLGNVVVYPHPFKPGICIMRGKGSRTKGFTAAELHAQEQFKRANAYAEASQTDPAYHAAHEVTHRTAFNLAMANFLNVPVVQDIDCSGYTGQAGETIQIQAVDDFDVSEVRVRILSLSGPELEKGSAVRQATSKAGWTYLATTNIAPGQTVVVEVTALDLPGNKTIKTADHACGPRIV